MDNNNIIIIFSYVASLLLLFLCIGIFSRTAPKSAGLTRRLLIGLGIVPGLVGVIFGFSLAFFQIDTSQMLLVMGAWLLLEFGTLQLSSMVKEYKIVSMNEFP
jgi:L-cystine uptake protein TcyP (sodium:dicarboxylate symporter family)